MDEKKYLKKKLEPFIAVAATVILCVGAVFFLISRNNLFDRPQYVASDNRSSSIDSSVNSHDQSNSASEYNPFSQSGQITDEVNGATFGYGLCNPAADNRYEYQEEMTLDFYIENSSQTADFGLLLYVNGVLQEYSVADAADKHTMAHITVEKGEKKEFSVNFSPVCASDDETFCVSYAIMLNPDFAPQSDTTVFGNNHRISAMSISMSDVPENALTEKTLLCENAESIPCELQTQYYIYDEEGNVSANTLANNVSFRAESYTSSHSENNNTTHALTKNDSVNLTLLGGPQESKWRISMYCNHGLVSAFDGTSYIDMQASSDKMSTYTVPMSVIGDVAQQYSSVYFIASPIGSDGESYPIKSHSFVYVNE